MSILDNLLGGSDQAQQNQDSSSTSVNTGTDPGFGLSLSDLLHSSSSDSGIGDNGGDSSDFTGLGGLDLGFSAPSFLGISTSSDTSDTSATDGHNGGLLGGLL